MKGGIRNVRKFWPMPYDKVGDEAPEQPTEEMLEASIENIKLVAEQWLKD